MYKKKDNKIFKVVETEAIEEDILFHIEQHKEILKSLEDELIEFRAAV